MAKLSVNVNKIATLRNTRELGIPSVVHFSRIVLDAGAHGITVHPRPDQRHIRPSDVDDLVQEVLAVVLRELPQFEHNGRTGAFRRWLRTILLWSIAQDHVGDRPDRFEPRARKRRPKPYPLLMKPRKQARAALLKAS